MSKIINLFFLFFILFFLFFTFKYYSSQNNIDAKEFNRKNIDEIINQKILDLPILENNTDNVIQFNDGYSNEIKDEKSKFLELIKIKMKKKAIIISIQGPKLSQKKILLSKEKPWGLILFKRNIKSFIQIKINCRDKKNYKRYKISNYHR